MMLWAYVLTMLDNWGKALSLVSVGALCVFGVSLLGLLLSNDGDADCFFESFRKFKINIILKIFIVSFSILIFLPTTKQAAFILIAPQLIENGEVRETFKNIPELSKLGTEYLKEILKNKIEGGKK